MLSRKRIKRGLVIIFLVGGIYFTHLSIQSTYWQGPHRKHAKTSDSDNVKIIAHLPPPNVADLASDWHNDVIKKSRKNKQASDSDSRLPGSKNRNAMFVVEDDDGAGDEEEEERAREDLEDETLIVEKEQKQQIKPETDKRFEHERGKKEKTYSLKKKFIEEEDGTSVTRSSLPSFESLGGDGLYLLKTSGYWDNDEQIRVFGLMKTDGNSSPSLKCKFYRSDSSQEQQNVPIVTEGQVIRIKDTPKKKYTACYILCTTTPDVITMKPQHVDISSKSSPVSQDLKIPIQPRDSDMTSEFTLCVGPVSGKKRKMAGIVEMIELNKILGATRIYIYDTHTDIAMSKVLKYFHAQQPGFLNVINWSFPSKTVKDSPVDLSTDVNELAKVTAMNDCLYRNRFRSRYVLFLEMDEYLIPSIKTSFDTWKQLIADRSNANPKAATFSFLCANFPSQWLDKSNETTSFVQKETSLVFSHVYREDVLEGGEKGCRVMLNPMAVEIVGTDLDFGTDLLWEYVSVPGSQAAVFRYKKRHEPGESKRVYDRSVITKYKYKVETTVRTTFSHLKKWLKKTNTKS